jgi:hypothetical protein
VKCLSVALLETLAQGSTEGVLAGVAEREQELELQDKEKEDLAVDLPSSTSNIDI